MLIKRQKTVTVWRVEVRVGAGTHDRKRESEPWHLFNHPKRWVRCFFSNILHLLKMWKVRQKAGKHETCERSQTLPRRNEPQCRMPEQNKSSTRERRKQEPETFSGQIFTMAERSQIGQLRCNLLSTDMNRMMVLVHSWFTGYRTSTCN